MRLLGSAGQSTASFVPGQLRVRSSPQRHSLNEGGRPEAIIIELGGWRGRHRRARQRLLWRGVSTFCTISQTCMSNVLALIYDFVAIYATQSHTDDRLSGNVLPSTAVHAPSAHRVAQFTGLHQLVASRLAPRRYSQSLAYPISTASAISLLISSSSTKGSSVSSPFFS